MLVFLEDIYKFDYSEVPIVVIDCRVLLFEVLSKYELQIDRLSKDSQLSDIWFKCQWSLIINHPLPWMVNRPDQGFYVIVVDDYKREDKTYWRNDYTEPFGFPRYKGNRNLGERPDYYYQIHESCLEYLQWASESRKCPIPIFRQEGFEADDWAGAVYRNCNGVNPVFLNTVDNDWMQLIDDNKKILFACNRMYKPQLRTEYEALRWNHNKGMYISSPRQIVDMKVRYGDEGDNLIPGSPREVIDLVEPPLKPDDSVLKLHLSPTSSNTNENHYQSSFRWLVQNDLI